METDHKLMARVSSGDREAFGTIVRGHQERMQRFAWRMLGDRDAASDVVQEAFVRVWQSRASYAPTASLSCFLLRVVRNACIDHIRASKKWDSVRIDDDVPLNGPSCEALAESSVLHDAIGQVLLRIPEIQRVIFVLSEYEGLSYQEIAEVVGCPYGTVASRKYAAVEALRTQLRPWINEEKLP